MTMTMTIFKTINIRGSWVMGMYKLFDHFSQLFYWYKIISKIIKAVLTEFWVGNDINEANTLQNTLYSCQIIPMSPFY